MAEVRLYDSTICRLCATDNENGELLFTEKSDGADLSSMVNRYLPLKVQDDGKLPRTICSACNIQLEATVQFFELLINGQRKIREIYKQQVEQQKKAEKERLRMERNISEVGIADLSDSENVEENYENKEFQQHIIIKIMPDGSVYAAEHEMSLQMEGLDKPKRKRGRPPKIEKIDADDEREKIDVKEHIIESISQEEDDKQDEDIEELDGDSRRRRKRKAPKRFMEAVQGKELERIFKEEGVIDEEEGDIDINAVDDSGRKVELIIPDSHEEVIGYLETEEGKDLGELVIINKMRGRGRPKLGRRKNRFVCNICNKGFSQRSRYIIHRNYHKDEKYECTECKKMYNSKDNLTLHQKTTGHSGETIKEINDAEDVSAQNQSYTMDESMDIESLNEAVIQKVESEQNSEELGKATSVETLQEMSMEEVDKVSIKGDKYPCDICGKVLNHPSSVVYHKEAEHNNGRRFVCNKCKKSFKHKQLLQRHQLVHSNDRPYACKKCDASFKTKANLINHQSTHTGEKKYICTMCNQQFAHKTSLTLHYRWHSGEKPYKCDVCEKSFSQNGNLQEHMRIHTGEKPYCCHACGRKFTTSSQFKLHLKRHTGERPWKCEFCAKSFLHKDTWKCHVRRHKGEKPFKCPHCTRDFTEQWALKKHVRLHTGEKPYKCDVCQKAFADCSNLTKHKKVHRENKVIEIDETDDTAIKEVWIVPHSDDVDESSLGDQMTQVITTDDTTGNGASQIIYVSYQDPDDLVQSRTLQLAVVENKETSTMAINKQPLSIIKVNNEEMVSKEAIENETYQNEDTDAELEEPDVQLQITDDKGNPVSLTMEQARQLLSDKNIVNQLNERQTIRVYSDFVSGGRTTTNQSPMGIINLTKVDDITDKSATQTDAEVIAKELQDESTDATTVAVINQMETESRSTSMLENPQAIEFITQDGQKVRLLTTYQVDPIQLESEYLTIT